MAEKDLEELGEEGSGWVEERYRNGLQKGYRSGFGGGHKGGNGLWQEGTERGITEPPVGYIDEGGDEDLSCQWEMMGG